MRTTRRTRRAKPYASPLVASLASAVLAGQRLRSDESASATTFTLNYAAKRQVGRS